MTHEKQTIDPDGPSADSRPSILIVGGGIAGAIAARTLTDRGHRVLVLDKERGPGGRCSTRRSEVMAVDHGAQYFTVSDPRFKEAVDLWSQQGVVTHWLGRFFEVDHGQIAQAHGHDRWVVTPSMWRPSVKRSNHVRVWAH